MAQNTREDMRADLEHGLQQAEAARKAARARLREIQKKLIIRREDD